MVKQLAHSETWRRACPETCSENCWTFGDHVHGSSWGQEMCWQEKGAERKPVARFNVFKFFQRCYLLIQWWGFVFLLELRAYTKAFGYRVASIFPNMMDGVWGFRTPEDRWLKWFFYKYVYLLLSVHNTWPFYRDTIQTKDFVTVYWIAFFFGCCFKYQTSRTMKDQLQGWHQLRF